MEKKGRTQLFVQENSAISFIQEFEQLPAYFDLERMLRERPGSIASMGLFERIQAEAAFNQQSLKSPDQK